MAVDSPLSPNSLSGKSVWMSDNDVYDWFLINRQKNICGFRLKPSVVLSQIAEFLMQMSAYAEVKCVGLIDSDDIFSSKQIEFLNNLGVSLYRGKMSQCAVLAQLKVVFLQESNFSSEDFYSINTIRIGLSHGVDISLKKTLLQYGGLLEFDYILCTKPYAPLDNDAFVNLTVPEFRTHQKPFCCALPFGVPKFDRFLQLCHKNKQPTALVYHLSNLKIENPAVPLIIEDTLSFLLDNYPDRIIYFRPFPDDLLNGSIKIVHEKFKFYPNYRLSDDACYIEDYSKAKVMICHRVYSEHLFSQASGRPVFVIDPSDFEVKKRKNEINFFEMKSELDRYVNSDFNLECKSHVFNRGCSVRYLLDNFDYILKSKIHPDWQYFQLDHPQSVSRSQLIAYYLAGALPFHKVSLRNLALFPEDPTAWVAALVSLGRTPVYTNVQLSQMYWAEIVLILQRIVQTNIPMQCRKELKNWFEQLPLICRLFIREQLEITSTKPLVLELLDSFKSGDLQVNEPVVLDTPDLPLFVKKRDLSLQLAAGEIQLYGAGQLTRQLLADPRFTKRFDIVRLVDSNPSVQGSIVAGLVVESPVSLHQSSAPVLICSRAFSEEIEYSLRHQLALNRELYVLH